VLSWLAVCFVLAPFALAVANRCAGCACSGCPTICSTQIHSMSFTPSGFTDAAFNAARCPDQHTNQCPNGCASYNGYTFVVARDPNDPFCSVFVNRAQSPARCDNSASDQIGVDFTTSGGNTFATVDLQIGLTCTIGGSQTGGIYCWTFKSASLGASPVDCASLTGVALSLAANSGNVCLVNGTSQANPALYACDGNAASGVLDMT
jgi:hypothetical protein